LALAAISLSWRWISLSAIHRNIEDVWRIGSKENRHPAIVQRLQDALLYARHGIRRLELRLRHFLEGGCPLGNGPGGHETKFG
jgi:hypothetical protein